MHFLRNILVGLLVLCALVVWGMTRGQATDRPITPDDDLQSAINSASTGDVLLLAPGAYGKVTIGKISGGAQAVTLKSADAKNPAVFSGLVIKESRGLVLDGLLFDYTFVAGDNAGANKGLNWPFQILGSTDITIRNSVFDGDIARKGPKTEVNLPTATALVVRFGKGITIERSEIFGFQRGLAIDNSADTIIRGNDIHGLRMDGMNLAALTGALIEGNHIHDFNRSLATGDHADMIQFWTAGTKTPSTNITIRGNLLNSGGGLYTQSIFMRNEVVDQKQAGQEMFYRDLLIEQNVIINAHLHGITVGEVDGLVVRNNTLIHNRRSDGPEKNPPLWIPQINMAKRSVNVSLTDNISFPIPIAKLPKDWTITGNLAAQDRDAGKPSYYDRIFVAARAGNPDDLGNYAYLPGGPAGSGAVGAAALRPDRVGDFARTFASVTPLSGTLQVVVDSPEPSIRPIVVATTVEILRFTGKSGMLAKGPNGMEQVGGIVTADLGADGRVIEIGPGSGAIALPTAAIADFFGAGAFDLALRFRTTPGGAGGGEILRVHQALIVTLTPVGGIEVQLFQPGMSDPVTLRTGPLKLHDGNWHDLAVRYDAVIGKVSIHVDGAMRAGARATLPVVPMGNWGLSFGNGFGQASFQGQIVAIQLNSVSARIAP